MTPAIARPQQQAGNISNARAIAASAGAYTALENEYRRRQEFLTIGQQRFLARARTEGWTIQATRGWLDWDWSMEQSTIQIAFS